jgi:hypothetical protein
MPYDTITGGLEQASWLGHSEAAIRTLAERASFYVPAEHLRDLAWLRLKIRPKAGLPGVIGVDGSMMPVRVRDGLPSVHYRYAQAAAVWLDIDAMESQRAERFVDPVVLHNAVTSALVSLDLPLSGAYLREGISIQDSWRERVDSLFRTKKVEVNRLNQSLLRLLLLVHGQPGRPATTVPVNCPARRCDQRQVPVGASGMSCPGCGEHLFPADTLRIYEEVTEEGSNQVALGRLMQVIELLVLVGLTTLLWEQSRHDVLRSTLFIMDGPLAMFGPPAKLHDRAVTYFQQMIATTPGAGPYLCGVEKSGRSPTTRPRWPGTTRSIPVTCSSSMPTCWPPSSTPATRSPMAPKRTGGGSSSTAPSTGGSSSSPFRRLPASRTTITAASQTPRPTPAFRPSWTWSTGRDPRCTGTA